MALPIVQVDAFTDRPFAGNPAAVCLLSEPAEERWMQAVAAEMNLSETAFLLPENEDYQLRWFTPTMEVDLCGHATLASAHVLWETGALAPDAPARFFTRSGPLTAARRGEWIEMDFPSEVSERCEAPEGLVQGLRAQSRWVSRNRFDYLVEVDSEEVVRELKPDLAVLAAVPVRGIIVTSQASSGRFDFISRFFAPAAGIDEDPVTGSAHCCLGPFWGERLGKTELLGYQASARGGTVRVRLASDRVLLGGQAVTVFRGELLV
jgi:predicted PhzF superfamily epimerase YddE/YHI9